MKEERKSSRLIRLTFLRGQHVVGRQKVKGFKAVHIQFQGLFVAGGGQQSVVHGIIDLTAQQANGAADLKYTRDGRKKKTAEGKS